MIPITRDQQESVLVAISIDANASDLSLIVDVLGMHQIKRRAGGNQRIQIEDFPILPQESP